MARTGIANFTLDYGRCPRWLFERMVRLSRVIVSAIVAEFGPEEFLRRLADPVWFQSLGCVLAFDWNASGLTTTTLAALKVALSGLEKDLNVFICGGKGKTSRKTPEQIQLWSERLGLSQNLFNNLVYASRACAKVDSGLIQDGFQIYHHNFIFTKEGRWTVIQQGMNEKILRARRYHWYAEDFRDFVEEPHSGIASQVRLPSVLDLTAKKSSRNRKISVQLISSSKTLFSDLKILAQKFKPQKIFKILELPNIEFHRHPVLDVDFQSPRLQKNLQKLTILKPSTFEKLMMTPGVGGKTIRSLSLVSEIIYAAKPSYEDPARYSFAHGGKDGTPFPVDKKTYDKSLEVMEKALKLSSIGYYEKEKALRRLEHAFR